MAKEELTKTVTMSLIVLATTTGVAVLQAGSATANPGSDVGTGATNSADASPGPIGVPPGINKLFLKFTNDLKFTNLTPVIKISPLFLKFTNDLKFTNLAPALKISALFHKFSADGSVAPPPPGR
jgi:hypothetical protein